MNSRTNFFQKKAIISPNHIVTAAHCVTNDKKEVSMAADIAVVAGIVSTTDAKSGQIRVPRKICVHHTWGTNGFAGDIAVLELNEPLSLTSQVKPAIRESSAVSVGTSMTVTGWGLTETGSTSELRKVDVPVVTGTRCGSEFLDSAMICAGYLASGADACPGDSGGPLQRRSGTDWIFSGITSFGPSECGGAYSAGSYVKVSNYNTWFEKYFSFFYFQQRFD